MLPRGPSDFFFLSAASLTAPCILWSITRPPEAHSSLSTTTSTWHARAKSLLSWAARSTASTRPRSPPATTHHHRPVQTLWPLVMPVVLPVRGMAPAQAIRAHARHRAGMEPGEMVVGTVTMETRKATTVRVSMLPCSLQPQSASASAVPTCLCPPHHRRRLPPCGGGAAAKRC